MFVKAHGTGEGSNYQESNKLLQEMPKTLTEPLSNVCFSRDECLEIRSCRKCMIGAANKEEEKPANKRDKKKKIYIHVELYQSY